MAARKGAERQVDDLDDLDTTIDEDITADTDDEALEDRLEDDFDDQELDPQLDPQIEDPGTELDQFEDEDDELATADLDRVAAEEDAGDDDDGEEAAGPTLPPEAEFDDDAADIVAVVADPAEDFEEVDGVRAGEFVCRSCYLAKRETQLADPKRLLCRDCA